MSELIIYQSDDGKAQVQFRALEGSLWLTQLQLAELYGVTVANINIHLRKIEQEGELVGEAVIKQDLITAADCNTTPQNSIDWTWYWPWATACARCAHPVPPTRWTRSTGRFSSF